jgi:hypothetical protein
MATYQEEAGKEASFQNSRVVKFNNMEEFRARNYQLEMLDQSLIRNVIVTVR